MSQLRLISAGLPNNMTKLIVPIFMSLHGIEVCFSYDTPIVAFNHAEEKVYMLDHKISRTTTKHLNKFLSDSEPQTENYEQVSCTSQYMDSIVGQTMVQTAHAT